MQLKFDIHDNATPTLRRLITLFPNTARGAVKSTGYYLVGKARDPGPFREEIGTDAPGGVPYAKFGNPKFRRALDQILKGQGKRTYRPYGRLDKALRYRYTSSRARGYGVTVGFVSDSSYKLAKKLAQGFSSNMSENRARLWNKAFQRLGWTSRVNPNKKTVDVPARPAINPMWNKYRANAMKVFETKFRQYLKNDVARGGR